MVTLVTAINMAARLIEDSITDQPLVHHDLALREYVRGMANILAELYPIISMPHDERSDQIERWIVRAAQGGTYPQ